MIDAGPIVSLAEGAHRMVKAGKCEIAIMAWQDEVFAIGNRCPHQGASLCQGHVSALVRAASPGSLALEVDTHRPVVACPWHHWEFDLRTGRAIWDQRFRLRVYPVAVEHGRISVGTHRP